MARARFVRWPWGELLLDGLSTANGELMESLDWCEVASPRQIHDFIRCHRLAGKGVGWVDAALLAAPSRAAGDELRPGRLCERVEDKPLPWIPVRRNEWMTATGTTES